jgi:hypothetical protein
MMVGVSARRSSEESACMRVTLEHGQSIVATRLKN